MKITAKHERAIGEIVGAWNEYQAELSQMFGKLLGRKAHGLELAAWHALDNDQSPPHTAVVLQPNI